MNWYRTSKANFDDERPLLGKVVEQPVLFILATQDAILTRGMADASMPLLPNVTRREVPTSHWALWQDPRGVNDHIAEWLTGVVFGGKSHL